MYWHRQPWGSIWGSLPTTHAKANAKQMRSRSSRAERLLTLDCLHVQFAVHAGNLRTQRTTVILITGKTQRPPCWDQDGAGSGISGVYLLLSMQMQSGSLEFT